MRIVTVIALALLACRSDNRLPRSPRPLPLRIGTTTTVLQSGMLALAESLWTGAPLTPVIGPSGQILHSAAQGDLDVALTHAPALEAKLLAGTNGLVRCPFVTSRFAIVGPADDPAQVATAGTAAQLMERIAGHAARFVSRGDSSGTHERELALWRAANIEPRGQAWYIESGSDQTTTLRIADERRGYALADLPTFARVPGLAMHRLFAADSLLENRYTLYRIPDPKPHPASRRFVTWALGTWRSQVLAQRLPDGTAAFEPPAGGDSCTTS